MSVSRETVEKVAALAHLRLGADEADRLTGELSVILDHIGAIAALDSSPVAGDPAVHGPAAVLRGDPPSQVLAPAEALYNAPAARDLFFSVPRVLTER